LSTVEQRAQTERLLTAIAKSQGVEVELVDIDDKIYEYNQWLDSPLEESKAPERSSKVRTLMEAFGMGEYRK